MIINSPDISVLDFKVLVDISTVTPTIKFINQSTGVNLAGVKWIFNAYTPNNTPIHISSFASPDITGVWTNFTLPENIPQLQNNIIWSGSEYRFVVTIQDSLGAEFTLEIGKDICRPNGNVNGSNYGKGALELEVRCNEAKIYVADKTNYSYKRQVAPSLVIQKKLTLVYPPTDQGVYPPPYIINDFTNGLIPISASGSGYQVILESIVQYDLGDGITLQVKYKLIESFAVQCDIDLCELICEYSDMVKKAEGNCDKEAASNLLLINAKINQAIIGKMQPLCKVDVGKLVDEIKVLGGFSCNCNCGTGINTLINNPPSTIFDCNDVIACIDNFFDTLDPLCLVTPLQWQTMTLSGKMQVILNSLGTLLCNVITPLHCADFATDLFQKNAAVQNDYDFMARDISVPNVCTPFSISPPTGFAVAGNTRKSAFGSMEWFSNLANANAAAVAGETVLLFNDTVENLVIKANVNYFGVGKHSIGNISDVAGASTNYLSNLTIGILSLTNSIIVFATNVTITGTATFNGSVKWNGGNFTNNTPSVQAIGIFGTAQVSDIYGKCKVSMSVSGKLDNSKIFDESVADGLFAVYLDNGNPSTDICSLTNCLVNSINNAGVQSLVTVNKNIINGNTIRTINKTALRVNGGNIISQGKSLCSGNNISNIGTDPAVIIEKVANVGALLDATDYFFANNKVYSETGVGVLSDLGNIKSCDVYSNTNDAIVITGANNQGFNLGIVDCTAESKGGKAIRANRDIFITGGTYISRLDSAAGNPIFIDNSAQGGVPNIKYKIAGVKTIATSPLAYAIKGNAAAPVSATITKNTFLCEITDSPVLGIDTANITPIAVVVDSFGNIN